MLVISLIIGLSMIFLLAASYFDLKTGEVPEKISRGFIFSILFLAFLLSVFQLDWRPSAFTILIGGIYFVFGYVTYHLGQWGGGDVKILAGIGLSLGLLYSLNFEFQNSIVIPYFIGYFINMGIVMLPYMFLYGIFISLKKREVFGEYIKSIQSKKFVFFLIISFIPSIIAIYFDLGFLSLIYLIIPIFVFLSFYLKVVEDIALVETIPVASLREGDVPAKDFSLGDKKISSRNIDGLTKEEVEEIKKLAKKKKFSQKIEIKFGIKSVPILMLAFIILILFGNVLEIVIL